jgi:mRNA-degrading endonuclease RelE of RelBE toxin-antitoxin system
LTNFRRDLRAFDRELGSGGKVFNGGRPRRRLVRPDDYGIPLDHEGWDERTVRNVALSWEQVKASKNPLWEKGFQFYCLTPKSRHRVHSSWSTVDWTIILDSNFGDPYRTDKRLPGPGDHQIHLNPQAAKDLYKLATRNKPLGRALIETHIPRILHNPYHAGGKKQGALSHVWGYDLSFNGACYRILYLIQKDFVRFIAFGTHDVAYRKAEGRA